MQSIVKNGIRSTSEFYHGLLGLLPDYLIIGGMRCGTTSLYEYLIAHPTIFPASQKEVHFFDGNYHRGISWYRSHLPTVLHKAFIEHIQREMFVTGEATPSYLFHPTAPEKIARLLPRVRLIVLLRNPVDRAFSHYNFIIKHIPRHFSFEESLEAEERALTMRAEGKIPDDDEFYDIHRILSFLQRGIYADQLERWFKYYPREQFLILQSEELYAQPESIFAQVLAFLNIPADKYQANISFKRHNPADYQVAMAPNIREQLVEYFKPHNERLYQLLGRSFFWE